MTNDEMRLHILQSLLDAKAAELDEAKTIIHSLLRIVDGDFSVEALDPGEATTIQVAQRFVTS